MRGRVNVPPFLTLKNTLYENCYFLYIYNYLFSNYWLQKKYFDY